MSDRLKNGKSKRLEIERKFLVKNNAWRKGAKGVLYQQGYLSTDPSRTVRIRLEGTVGKLTIKGKKVGLAGDEFEYDIPWNDSTYLLKKICKQPIIKKKRYKISYEGAIWEVDVFEGENKGLILAEVELDSASQKIRIPEWIGKEVTGDRRFRNANLVTHPYSKWKHEINS
jgi:adenylate cyclase